MCTPRVEITNSLVSDKMFGTSEYFRIRIPSVGFIKFKGPLHIFKSIHNGDIALEEIQKEQIKLKRGLGCIKQGNPRDQ